MVITVNIICALLGAVFGWLAAYSYYRVQVQHEEGERTGDAAFEDGKAVRDDILKPLAAKLSETMREWREKDTIFPVNVGQGGAAASSLDLKYLGEYIIEPKADMTPSPIVRSIRNIIKRTEHYNEGFTEAAIRAMQAAAEGFGDVQTQCNRYLFIGLNKIRVNQRRFEPDVYLQSYLANEHNYSKFCPYIFGDRMISVSSLKASQSRFADKEVEIAPENIESLIAARKEECEEYGYNAQQIKDELWHFYVMRDIFDKEKEISREVKNHVKEAALKEELDSIAVSLNELKTGLEGGMEEEAGNKRHKTRQ